VPQGLLLGPVLFTIFINDLTQYTEGSHVLLFADDAKIFKDIVNVKDCEALQNSIDLLTEWGRINEMSLNASKSHVFIMSHLLPFVIIDLYYFHRALLHLLFVIYS
jgi:hypothetical protein